MKFYDREQEINTIHEWIRLSEKRLQVGVIYGRRRVGKTRLINEAVRGHPFLYCFVERKPLSDLLSDFQEGLSAITDLFSGVTLESLIAFLNLLERLAERQPLVVVFDEFQNFRYIDPSVFSTFQKWIDANQDRTGLTIIFIGSMFSLMKKIFTEYKEPLYGRMTGQILLKPLTPIVEAEILSDLDLFTPANWLRFHVLFGGVPRYYALLADRAENLSSPLEAIRELIVSPFAVLKDEGKALLMEEFGKKYMVYFSILQAISRGSTNRSHIANATGLNYNRLGPYLDDLEKHYELIERRTPIFSKKETSKNSNYRLYDPFTRFWFRYLFKYGRYLEIEAYDTLMSIIEKDLPVLEGIAFENMIRELLCILNRVGKWDFPFEDIGGYWDRKNREIDIVVLNETKHTILFAECKLNARRVNQALMNNLKINSEAILRKRKDLKPIYGAFVVNEDDFQYAIDEKVWSLEKLLLIATEH